MSPRGSKRDARTGSDPQLARLSRTGVRQSASLAVREGRRRCADKPDGHGASKGAMAIVTIYGQDDADFARRVQQWGDWWKARYPSTEGPQT